MIHALSDDEVIRLFDQACAKRQPLRERTNALRLINSSGDSLPGIVLEQYDRHFVIHDYAGAADAVLKILTDTLIQRCDPEYLVVKHRYVEGGREHDASNIEVLVDRGGSQTRVEEYGLSFQVDLNDTLNSGLFLDMRSTRKRVAERAPQKEVLNCFAYTCSFGVHCRAAGASRVVNIDVSAKILDRGRANYTLNQLKPMDNEFVLADAVRYLKGAAKRDNRFDCVILDPPTFARHKGNVFSITKALPELMPLAFAVLKPGGTLLTATNCSAIGTDRLKQEILAGAKQKGAEVKTLTPFGQDEDFPGSGTMKESFLSCVLAETA